MRLLGNDLTLPPPAIGGIVVVLLLLLGLAVVVLRSGDEPTTADVRDDTTITEGDADDPDGRRPASPDPDAHDDDDPVPVTPSPTADVQDPPQDGAAADGPPPGGGTAEDGAADGMAPADGLTAADLPLPPGTCVNDDGRGSTVGSVEVVDCADPHSGEIFTRSVVAQPEGTPYPGLQVLQAEARPLCQGQPFEEFVGTPWTESRFFTYALLPTQETWDSGDRDVACVLYDVRGPLVGSQQGTRQ